MFQHRKRYSVTTVDNQDTSLRNAKQLGGPVHHHLDLHEEKLGLAQTAMTFECMTTAKHNLMLAISIIGKPVQAVVDTAAKITESAEPLLTLSHFHTTPNTWRKSYNERYRKFQLH